MSILILGLKIVPKPISRKMRARRIYKFPYCKSVTEKAATMYYQIIQGFKNKTFQILKSAQVLTRYKMYFVTKNLFSQWMI